MELFIFVIWFVFLLSFKAKKEKSFGLRSQEKLLNTLVEHGEYSSSKALSELASSPIAGILAIGAAGAILLFAFSHTFNKGNSDAQSSRKATTTTSSSSRSRKRK